MKRCSVRAVAVFLTLLPSLLYSGCVSLGQYQYLERQHRSTLDELARSQAQLRKYAQLESDLRRLKRANDRRIRALLEELEHLDSQEQVYRSELERAQLQAEALSHTLDTTKQELASMESSIHTQQSALERYQTKLKALIDAGDLQVAVEDSRLVVELPSDILFSSGSANLSQRGRYTLEELGTLLAEMPNKRYQVEGHTDSDPVRVGKFASNWHLGHARAMAVLEVLAQSGVPKSHLSAASFGEFRPKAPNETPEGKGLNRRIEIVVVPDLDAIAEEYPSTNEKQP